METNELTPRNPEDDDQDGVCGAVLGSRQRGSTATHS